MADIAPAKGMDFIVCRHDACGFIQELLADEIIRPAALFPAECHDNLRVHRFGAPPGDQRVAIRPVLPFFRAMLRIAISVPAGLS